MPKRIVPLTDKQIDNAKSKEKPYTIFDGGGLFLLINPAPKGEPSKVTLKGSKLWRMKYRYEGKAKILTFGSYPATSLTRARELRASARELLERGIDPSAARRQADVDEAIRKAITFKALADEWMLKRSDELNPKSLKKFSGWLRGDIFPAIGDIPAADLTPRIILDKVLRPIESRSIESAHRVRSLISHILRYGIACDKCERDATADLRGALKAVQRQHFPALTDPVKVGALLRSIDGFDGTFIVKQALRLHPFVAVRPGELRYAEWSEIDASTATWSIPAGRMKMKNPHIVPLSQQALAIIEELRLLTGSGKYLFPGMRTNARPISDVTLNAALRRLGYDGDEMVAHGWRAVFRTLADEVLRERVDIIEAQLAHQVADPLGRSYNRTTFLPERRLLMQRWADYLEDLKQKTGRQPLACTL